MRFSTLVDNSYHVCAIAMPDGTLYCWGRNDHYQLGHEPNATRDSVAKSPGGGFRARAVSASIFRTCALDLGGAAFCWGGQGANAPASLGLEGVAAPVTTPQPVAGGLTFTSISVSDGRQCAISASADGYCWGSSGGLGIGGSTPTSVGPQLLAGGLKWQWIGTQNVRGTCGLTTDGDAYCWGGFEPSALAARIGPLASSPHRIRTGVKFVALSYTARGPCGITSDGRALCW
jgi:hypothetical protein